MHLLQLTREKEKRALALRSLAMGCRPPSQQIRTSKQSGRYSYHNGHLEAESVYLYEALKLI